ncbi:CHASE2 domain-containing sensor protein [Salinibacter ruber]|nr:CHASE2 domain-containing sensor protein [Salinibacter ruber]
MTYLLYVLAGFSLLMGLMLLTGSVLKRSLGAFLGAASFGLAGGTAIVYVSWWPLAAGLLVVFLLRTAGLDPSYK